LLKIQFDEGRESKNIGERKKKREKKKVCAKKERKKNFGD
jgi:hypothetical protein